MKSIHILNSSQFIVYCERERESRIEREHSRRFVTDILDNDRFRFLFSFVPAITISSFIVLSFGGGDLSTQKSDRNRSYELWHIYWFIWARVLFMVSLFSQLMIIVSDDLYSDSQNVCCRLFCIIIFLLFFFILVRNRPWSISADGCRIRSENRTD